MGTPLRTPLFWVELTFKGYEDPMILCVSLFIFCLEPMLRKQLDENYYGILFKVPFRNHLITAILKVLSRQLQGTLTMVFETIHYS